MRLARIMKIKKRTKYLLLAAALCLLVCLVLLLTGKKPDGDAYLDAAAEKVETENLYD